MHKKFEINQTKISGGCKSGRKVVTHDSKSDLTLIPMYGSFFKYSYAPNSRIGLNKRIGLTIVLKKISVLA